MMKALSCERLYLKPLDYVLSALLLIFTSGLSYGQENPAKLDKPTILVLGTGGTIAGTAAAAADGMGYQSAALSIDQLLEALPGAAGLATLRGQQVANIGSQDMTEDVWLRLARVLNEQATDPSVDGFVITHGTDSLEETAFFLDQVYSGEKPVALTAAMRPADVVSSDGPINMLDAISAVTVLTGKGRRVLVVMNNRFHDPRFVTKRHTENTDAIRSSNGALVGEMVKGKPVIYAAASQCNGPTTNLRETETLPYVPIFYMHVGHEPGLIANLVDSGAQGIVTAGYGNGNTGEAMVMALGAAQQQGVEVVRSTKVGGGYVSRNVEVNDSLHGFHAAFDLSPQKARIVLSLALLDGLEGDALQRRLERPSC